MDTGNNNKFTVYQGKYELHPVSASFDSVSIMLTNTNEVIFMSDAIDVTDSWNFAWLPDACRPNQNIEIPVIAMLNSGKRINTYLLVGAGGYLSVPTYNSVQAFETTITIPGQDFDVKINEMDNNVTIPPDTTFNFQPPEKMNVSMKDGYNEQAGWFDSWATIDGVDTSFKLSNQWLYMLNNNLSYVLNYGITIPHKTPEYTIHFYNIGAQTFDTTIYTKDTGEYITKICLNGLSYNVSNKYYTDGEGRQ